MKDFKLWLNNFLGLYVLLVIVGYFGDWLIWSETKPIEKYLLSNLLFSIIFSYFNYKQILHNREKKLKEKNKQLA
jgi:hypothetical protein